MKISKEGIKLIKNHEGLRLESYDDLQPHINNPENIKGTLTIGYGHTGKDVLKGQKITEIQAEQFLKKDLERAENAVNKLFNDYGWRPVQNRFDALVSWVYNTGIGNLKNRSLIKAIDRFDKAEKSLITFWNKYYITSKGVKLRGLERRRADETNFFIQNKTL